MDGVTHELDPDGDVILILQEPIKTPFAVWEDSSQSALPKSTSSSSNTANLATGTPKRAVNQITENVASDGTTKHVTTQLSNGQDLTSTDQARSHGGMEVRMRVSSRHLILASRYFKRMLKGNWKESHTLSSDNSIVIHIFDWDPDIFLILMCIIHHGKRKVPTEMSLETLAKFALLVDYYECLEAVELFVETWTSNLESTFSPVYSRNLILWLWISWVFQNQRLFDKAVITVTEHANGPMKTLGLHIPKEVTGMPSTTLAGDIVNIPLITPADKINQKREELTNEIVTSLHTLLASFLKDTYACSFECKSILFGALGIQMREWKIYPKPQAPFSDLSGSNLIRHMRKVKSPNWHTYTYYQSYTEHSCGFESIQKVADGIREKFQSFSLKSLLNT